MKSRLPPFKETPDLRGCHHKKGPYTTGTINVNEKKNEGGSAFVFPVIFRLP